MEKVNHPAHYQQEGKKECIWQMIDDYGKKVTAIFCITNAYKYLYRAGNKPDAPLKEDKAKAKWYIDFVEAHLFSSIQGANLIRMYRDVKKGLK